MITKILLCIIVSLLMGWISWMAGKNPNKQSKLMVLVILIYGIYLYIHQVWL